MKNHSIEFPSAVYMYSLQHVVERTRKILFFNTNMYFILYETFIRLACFPSLSIVFVYIVLYYYLAWMDYNDNAKYIELTDVIANILFKQKLAKLSPTSSKFNSIQFDGHNLICLICFSQKLVFIFL